MITTGTQSVGATAAPLDGITAGPCQLYVRNNDTTKTLYIGGPSVTVANGFGIDKSSTQVFTVPAGEQLWMVSTENGHTISWLRLVQ